MPSSAAVIGMTREDRRRPVELLGQQDPDQPVRPSLQSQGDAVRGGVPQGAEAAGAADEETGGPGALVPEPCEKIGKGLAGQGLAGRVEGDPMRARRDGGLQDFQFLRAGSARHLAQAEGLQAEPCGERGEARGIVLVKDPLGRPFFQTSDGEDADIQRSGSGGDRLAFARHIRGPELLELVELAHLRTEDVDDGIARVDQHPIAMGQALDPDIPLAGRLQPFHEMLGDRADMPLRAAARHDHIIGDRRLTVKVDRHDVFGFVIFEGIENELDEIRAIGGATTVTGQSRFSYG